MQLDYVSAVQHERKPILDKKDYPNNSNSNFNPSPVNTVKGIFIRRDLNTESGIINNPFNQCDIGLQFLTKRISKLVFVVQEFLWT